jgi:phenylacetate-CoA ligase
MLLDLILSAKGYPMRQARRDLKSIQQMPHHEFEQWQENKRWETARHHFDHNKTYKSLFKNGFPENWSALPVLQKSNLQANLETLITEPFKRPHLHIGNTSGSSGHPFYYAKDKYAHAITYALIANRYQWHGLSLSHKQARFYGIPLSGKSRWLEQLKDLMANRVRFPVFDLSDTQLKRFLEKFAANQFQYLYGYTSALVLFARFLLAEKITLKTICPSLKACIVTSEVCSQEDKMLLENGFGLPVINEYGASELDIIAFANPKNDWIISTENLFVEILDDDNQPLPDGEVGKIVVTSLHNRAFPMVRYEIGDLGSLERGPTTRLLQLAGRTNDVVQLPSGRTAAGLTFYYIARSLLESGADLKEFIIKQTAIDTFVFEVVSSAPVSEAVKKDIQTALNTYLEHNLRVHIVKVDHIQRPASGKIKHFYSLIQ